MVDVISGTEDRRDQLDGALELLHFAFRAVIAEPDRILARRGLSRVHHRILYFVRRNPDLSVGRLFAILDVSKQALNAPLRTLIEKKLVTVTPSGEDGRVKQLRLTAQGEKLELLISGNQRDRFARVFSKLGPNHEAAWRDAMTLLAGMP